MLLRTVIELAYVTVKVSVCKSHVCHIRALHKTVQYTNVYPWYTIGERQLGNHVLGARTHDLNLSGLAGVKSWVINIHMTITWNAAKRCKIYINSYHSYYLTLVRYHVDCELNGVANLTYTGDVECDGRWGLFKQRWNFSSCLLSLLSIIKF